MATPIRRGTIPIVALLILAACGSEPVPTPSGSRAISFESEDGLRLAGRLFGEGNEGIVLAHMFPADQTSWFAFADRLASRGYRVLTFDFRGYCPGGEGGCSEGDKLTYDDWRDVLGAIEAIRDEGAVRVGLIGASMGGSASLLAASHPEVDVEVVITLSAPVSFQGLDVTPEVLSQVSAAKLFLAGHEDASAAESAQLLYDESIQPKKVQILTTGDHGTDILTGNQAGIASTEMLNWLERYLPTGA